MVEAGFGLALLPASSIDEELRAGTLTVLRVPAMKAAIPVVLIHRRRAFHSGATKALIAALTAWPSQPVPDEPAQRADRQRPATRRSAAQRHAVRR